jgi:uncharacterized protein
LIYLALDELDEVFRGRWLWSTRRPAIARFLRSDYLGPSEQDLRESVRSVIAAHGGQYDEGKIFLLTHLRYWGFGFNPVSFYYCFNRDESLAWIVAEVANTPWGQKHAYVVKADQLDDRGTETIRKEFHVSPFMTCDMDYQFRMTTPAASAAIHMDSFQNQIKKLDVTMQLKRREISTANLARVLLRYPAMTLQVIGHIYVQALRLYWKGVPFVPHPSPGIPHGNLNSKILSVNREEKNRSSAAAIAIGGPQSPVIETEDSISRAPFPAAGRLPFPCPSDQPTRKKVPLSEGKR